MQATRRRLDARAALGGLVFAVTLGTLAVGFIIPARPRLREPNEVHYDFRAQPSQQQQQRALLQSTHPALPLPTLGATATATAGATATEVDTLFEELFACDKSCGLEGWSILEGDSPINSDPLVVMEGAAFVPMQDITHENRVITQRGVGTGASSGAGGDKAALLKEVAAQLGVQARQALVLLKEQILAYVEGLLEAMQKLFAVDDAEGEGATGARARRRASRARRRVGERVAQRYQTARASAGAYYGELKTGALASLDSVEAAVSAKAATIKAELQLLVAACRSRVAVWRDAVGARLGLWQTALERDERYCLVKGRCAAVASRAQKLGVRALGKGRQLSVGAKAWGLRLQAKFLSDSGAAAGRPVGVRMLGGGVMSELMEGVADETQVPPFSLAYVSRGGASASMGVGVGVGGARAAYSSLLVSPFDDLEPFFMPLEEEKAQEDAPAPVMEEMVLLPAAVEEEPMVEEQEEKTAVASMTTDTTGGGLGSNAVLDALLKSRKEAEEEQAAMAAAAIVFAEEGDVIAKVVPTAEAEEQNEEDDGPSSGGGGSSSSSMDTMGSSSSPPSAPAVPQVFAGVEVTASEGAAAAALQARLATLAAAEAEAETQWVEAADLVRYAREFEGDVEAAWSALRRTCAWRAEQGVAAAVAEAEAEADYFRESPLSRELFWMGSEDREGDPVLLFRTALHRPGALPTAEYVRFMTHVLETGRRRYGLGKGKRLTLLVDRKDAGVRQQDPLLVMQVVPLLQAHYPGCFKVAFVAPVNAVFQFIWKIFTFILAPSTAHRVQLLGPGPEAYEGALRKQFFPDQLPMHLGGTLRSYEERSGDSSNGTHAKAGDGDKPALSAA